MVEKLPKEAMIMFDIDGTIAASKSAITKDMAEALCDVSQYKKIAIISGGTWEQFMEQIINHLPPSTHVENMYMLPTSGTRLYINRESHWQQEYAELLNDEEARLIKESLYNAVNIVMPHVEILYGEQIENRGTQISLSLLGQNAPLASKEICDPSGEIRKKIVALVEKTLHNFEVRIGGMTTIDVTKKGMDKGYGIQRLCTSIAAKLSDIVYVGDALFEGGNDYAAKKIGVHCIEVKNENETLEMLQRWNKEYAKRNGFWKFFFDIRDMF